MFGQNLPNVWIARPRVETNFGRLNIDTKPLSWMQLARIFCCGRVSYECVEIVSLGTSLSSGYDQRCFDAFFSFWREEAKVERILNSTIRETLYVDIIREIELDFILIIEMAHFWDLNLEHFHWWYASWEERQDSSLQISNHKQYSRYVLYSIGI